MTEMPPWEPPFNGDEAAAVFGALDRQRTTFRWKCADLDAAGLSATTARSKLTLGGLLKHLAVQEDYCFQVKILGLPMPAPWDLSIWETEGDDWEFDSAAADAPDELYSLWDTAVARSRAAVAKIVERGGLQSAAAISLPDGSPVNVRRMVMDLIEEYGRHTGHADILREAVDAAWVRIRRGRSVTEAGQRRIHLTAAVSHRQLKRKPPRATSTAARGDQTRALICRDPGGRQAAV